MSPIIMVHPQVALPADGSYLDVTQNADGSFTIQNGDVLAVVDGTGSPAQATVLANSAPQTLVQFQQGGALFTIQDVQRPVTT